MISIYYDNIENADLDKLREDFEKQYDQTFSTWSAISEMEMLGAAIKKAGSSAPLKVAKALDGMQWNSPMGMDTMRADNHQLLQPMFISVLDSGLRHVFPDVNMGFRGISRIEPEQTKMATTCKFPNAPE